MSITTELLDSISANLAQCEGGNAFFAAAALGNLRAHVEELEAIAHNNYAHLAAAEEREKALRAERDELLKVLKSVQARLDMTYQGGKTELHRSQEELLGYLMGGINMSRREITDALPQPVQG